MTVKGEHLAGFDPLGGDRGSVKSVPVSGKHGPSDPMVSGSMEHLSQAPRESLKFDGSGRNRMGSNGGVGDEGADAPRRTPLDDWTKRVVTSALPHWAETPALPPPSDDAALVKESLADPDRFAGSSTATRMRFTDMRHDG